MLRYACTNGKLIEPGHSTLTFNSFIGDATRLWNESPMSVRSTETVYKAKSKIKIC